MKGKEKLSLYQYAICFILFLVLAQLGPAFVWADGATVDIQEEPGSEIFVDFPVQEPQAGEEVSGTAESGTESFFIEGLQETELLPDTVPETSLEELPPEGLPEEEPELPEEPEDRSLEVFTDGSDSKDTGTYTVIHKDGLHYIEDPQYPDGRILIYCMNNQRNWPHYIESMGENQVPGYQEGYLREEMFDSAEDYQECLKRLSRLLYIGYPYNGERLYQIVPENQSKKPTEKEFDRMLVPPSVLQTAFPELGHHVFSYQDWVNKDEEHLQILGKFIHDVEKIRRGGTTVNGLTYEAITIMPFYKAAISMTYQAQETPLDIFALFYGDSYFVTEQQAYDATQLAVWRLMQFYHIEDNSIRDGELNASSLGKMLYIHSEKDEILEHKPSIHEIELKADLNFRYNPKDGMYHSGNIRIIEPENYHGLYRLILPEGVTAQCDNLTYVYGDEDYQLVAKEPPAEGAAFSIEADFVWLEALKQYSPQPDIEIKGKKFQHMAGAVIRNASIEARIPYQAMEEGGVQITKTVVGGDPNEEFGFCLELPDHKLNGLYGDLMFQEGKAEFTLKNGEIKQAVHLPAGAQYRVTEADTGEYEIRSEKDSGTVPKGTVQHVSFTNIRLPELLLSKEVTGEAGDKTRKFQFEITLSKASGEPVNGSFACKGSIKSGCEAQGVTAPENGTLEFKDGKARIMLSHGQQISIQNLPYKSFYTVRETAEDSYHTTYNGSTAEASGQLETKGEIHVINHKEFAPDTGIGDISGRGAGAVSMIALSGMLLLAGETYLRKRIKK